MLENITSDQDIICISNEDGRIAFDLQSRTLVVTTGCLQIKRLSQIDAHLLLALVYFYPHYVSDETLALGYGTNLFTYYTYLKQEGACKNLEGSYYPIKDGIERLRRKVIVLGITIARIRNLGYVLSPYPAFSTELNRMKELSVSDPRREAPGLVMSKPVVVQPAFPTTSAVGGRKNR
jgi:hypothetical protein